MHSFTERLSEAVSHASDRGEYRPYLTRAICDTVAVAAGGFRAPVTTAMVSAYPGTQARLWSGEHCEGAEAAALINATAAHALDFDDVLLESHVHASAVLLPIVLACTSEESEAFAAFSAGLIAARAVAALLGPDHYNRGWHGTGTIGAFAAAGAASRALRLDPAKTASAFALVAAMSGGLQANFGTMAKPAQAGFAAAAGIRAARLAAAGVTGAADIFGPNGFARLYGDGHSEPGDDMLVANPQGLSLKLYPSCFAAARLVGVALDARKQLGPIFDDPAIALHLSVPAGSLAVLRYDRPQSGAQAKFSAPYNVALALLAGTPKIAHFQDDAVADPAIAACMARLTIAEDAAQPSGGDIRTGAVALSVRSGGEELGHFTRSAIPGSADPSQLAAKWRDCFERFGEEAGRSFPARKTLEHIPAALALFRELGVSIE